MIRINQIKLSPGHTTEELKKAIVKALHINNSQLLEYKIAKKSIDARKGTIMFCYSVDVKLNEEKKILSRINNKNIMSTSIVKYTPSLTGKVHEKISPVIVGSGPAGLFCAYLLSKYGYCPIVIERGEDVDKRTRTVEKFWSSGILNPNSNVQFGEGGAGTFSDGKLNTLVKDKYGRNRFVLETFVEFGAPDSILYTNKPHIGTDVLRNVVKNMRMEIEKLGGKVLFNTCLTDITIDNGKISSITVNDNEKIDCDTLVLALGHSSRDTFKMLYNKNLIMEPKSFAVGVRVQHPQEMINLSQYKTNKYNEYLPAAEYKLTSNLATGRSVYSFCMCPGGYVVNSSSENNMVAINGMSYSKRDGKNANSALIVTVTPDDFESNTPLAGIEFQRKLERAAFIEGTGKIPVQLFSDFCNSKLSSEFGETKPQIKGGYEFANLRKIFPDYISESLISGMKEFAKKINDFDRPDAIFAGVESRTSSPLRILRNDDFESNIKGIYPCGEGAGYAGGITSAAMDGIKVFDAISSKIIPF